MTPRRFAWMLRALGPDLSGWPAPDHAEALALLRRDAAARAALADSLAADSLAADTLALDDRPEVDSAGRCRMQAAVHRALAPPRPVLRALRWGALALCLVAGLYLGISAAEPELQASGATVETSPATVLAALDP